MTIQFCMPKHWVLILHSGKVKGIYLEYIKPVTDFWVIGINYRKADTAIRGRYAITNDQYESILKASSSFGVTSLFVLATCNRTEIYGFAENAHQLIDLLCSYTDGNKEDFMAQSYIKNGNEALSHIFNVAAGLDSQILGDYEIVGQMKLSFHFAKERGYICAFIDRLFNTVLQSSRAIRTETSLSSGTVSVAYAAVQFIKNTSIQLNTAKILIIGSGEIGQNACRNLVNLVDRKNITLINRTQEKAISLANALKLNVAPFEQLQDYISNSDIIIVATAAKHPLLTSDHLKEEDHKLLIDLSIPNNIDATVKLFKNITLANVDDLSKINDETLRRRQEEVPQAKALITWHIHDFAQWYMMQQHVPVLKEVKEKLQQLNAQLHDARQLEEKDAVQKAINKMAKKMRTEEQKPGCSYIETISNYLAQTAN